MSYSPQADLLPLVLAHCNYSLHLGHGDNTTSTRLEYDFQGFELQLKNNLLLGKSRVQRKQHGVMEVMLSLLFLFLFRLKLTVVGWILLVFWLVCLLVSIYFFEGAGGIGRQ